jgi:cytochrome P450
MREIAVQPLPDRGREVMALVAMNDDMFTKDVIADPYTYYGRLREEDPVNWNEKYELWVITRYDDVVWLTRHHELFSSSIPQNTQFLNF